MDEKHQIEFIVEHLQINTRINVLNFDKQMPEVYWGRVKYLPWSYLKSG